MIPPPWPHGHHRLALLPTLPKGTRLRGNRALPPLTRMADPAEGNKEGDGSEMRGLEGD